MEGVKKRNSETGQGDGICRKCQGTGYIFVQPQWMKDAIAASGPAPFEVPGPLLTTPYKKGPLHVPGATPALLGPLD